MQVDSSTSQKRPGGTQGSEGTPPKVPAIQAPADSTTDLQNAMGLTGTGAEQASGGASSDGMAAYSIERPFSSFGYKENVYHKSHKFMTFGLAPVILPVQNEPPEPPTGAAMRLLTTYLAEIPWHLPGFYLTPSEFNLLPSGSRVKSVHVKVFYRGSTIQFETAATATQLATLNQINDIAVGHALNKTGWGSDFSFTNFNATQPMIATALTKPKYAPITGYRGMIEDYYGTNNDNIFFDNYIPHHQIGRQTFLYNYFTLSTRTATPIDPPNANINLFGGWYPIAEKIQQMDGKTVVNTCVLESSYTPKMGWLKQTLGTVGHGLPFAYAGAAQTILTQGHLIDARSVTFTRNTTSAETGAEANTKEVPLILGNDYGTLNTNVPLPTILTPIEKSQVSRSGWWGEQDPHIQPSLHIGVQPVPALNTGALTNDNTGTNSWTNCRGYWEVQATMVVIEHTPTSMPFATVPNVPLGENIISVNKNNWPTFNVDPAEQGATFCGLYPTQSTPL